MKKKYEKNLVTFFRFPFFHKLAHLSFDHFVQPVVPISLVPSEEYDQQNLTFLKSH